MQIWDFGKIPGGADDTIIAILKLDSRGSNLNDYRGRIDRRGHGQTGGATGRPAGFRRGHGQTGGLPAGRASGGAGPRADRRASGGQTGGQTRASVNGGARHGRAGPRGGPR